MTQTLLFQSLPKLKLMETDILWVVINSEDFSFNRFNGRAK